MGWGKMYEFRHDDYGRDDDDREERAYKEGCRDGYEKAMREMDGRGGYGERGYDDGRIIDGDGYGDGYGERRGVKNTGPYAGEYRRRRR